jgi:hypothetical protein
MTFFTAGMSKLMPFIGWIGPVWLIERLEEFNLGIYARFIAISQVVIGLLLLTRRFATLGTIMLVPMLLNILMITISQNWSGTPFIVGIMLLMNLGLLVYDYPRLKFLIADDPARLPPAPPLCTYPHLDGIWLLSLLIYITGIVLIPYFSFYRIFLVLGGLGFLFLSLRSLWLRYARNKH